MRRLNRLNRLTHSAALATLAVVGFTLSAAPAAVPVGAAFAAAIPADAQTPASSQVCTPLPGDEYLGEWRLVSPNAGGVLTVRRLTDLDLFIQVDTTSELTASTCSFTGLARRQPIFGDFAHFELVAAARLMPETRDERPPCVLHLRRLGGGGAGIEVLVQGGDCSWFCGTNAAGLGGRYEPR